MFNIASEKMRFKGANMPGADPGFFLGGGALVSCSISTPINLIVFFFAEYQLKTADHLRGGGGCVYIYIYIYINKSIQAIRRWIQNSALQLRSGLTVNRLLSMSTYGF